jgi:uroporphyrinogen decarboxylase
MFRVLFFETKTSSLWGSYEHPLSNFSRSGERRRGASSVPFCDCDYAMMTSRERVLMAFDHREPDRPPCWCGASPEFWQKSKAALELDDEGLRTRFGDDFREILPAYTKPVPGTTPGSWVTHFGVERAGYGYGQAVTHPLADATTEQEVLLYPWPTSESVDVSHVLPCARQHRGDFAILSGDPSPFWHDAMDLLGMENLFYKMYDHPDLVSRLISRITDFYYTVNEQLFEESASELDIFFIANDFGSQAGPLISEKLFNKFVVPSLSRLTELGHRYGLRVMLHCCGAIRPLLPSMIGARLDGVHALQPSCAGMEPAGLKRDFGKQLVLNGAIDSHAVLIDGDPEFVRNETKRILDIMAPGGGYVAGASHDYILEETPLENVLAMFDTVRGYKGS